MIFLGAGASSPFGINTSKELTLLMREKIETINPDLLAEIDLFRYLQKAILVRLSLRHLSKRELVSKLDAISADWDKKKDLTSMQAFEV